MVFECKEYTQVVFEPAEIYCQLLEIYGDNLMTDGMVKQWVRKFNNGQTNV